jgi:O-antigen ligase
MATRLGTSARRRTPPRAERDGVAPRDAVGAFLAGALGAWALVAAWGHPGARPVPVMALVAGTVASFAAGRILGRLRPWVLPGAVALGVAGALAPALTDLAAPLGPPTGYANANGTLAVLGAVAAATAAASANRVPVRAAWAAVAVALGAAAVATGSVAAVLAGAAVGALAVTSARAGRAAVALLGAGLVIVAVLGLTGLLAAGVDPFGWADHLHGRVELWADALRVLRDEPLRGAGPGRFSAAAGVVDPDLRWAHHGVLHHGAEHGLPGLVLLLALVGWVGARLRAALPREPVRAVAGASALSVVAVHASVDHVLHHPVVPLVLGAILGWATGRGARVTDPGSPG